MRCVGCDGVCRRLPPLAERISAHSLGFLRFSAVLPFLPLGPKRARDFRHRDCRVIARKNFQASKF